MDCMATRMRVYKLHTITPFIFKNVCSRCYFEYGHGSLSLFLSLSIISKDATHKLMDSFSIRLVVTAYTCCVIHWTHNTSFPDRWLVILGHSSWALDASWSVLPLPFLCFQSPTRCLKDQTITRPCMDEILVNTMTGLHHCYKSTWLIVHCSLSEWTLPRELVIHVACGCLTNKESWVW